MKTKLIKFILSLLACLCTASVAMAEEVDLKELHYGYENHLVTNDSEAGYLFHLEYPMVIVINQSRSLADSTALYLFERVEDGTQYAQIAEAHNALRASRTTYLWSNFEMKSKIISDTLALKNTQAFLCMSLPAGHYKLTSKKEDSKVHTSCLPELKTNIYAQAAATSLSDPVIITLTKSDDTYWNAAYQGKRTLSYQLAVKCNMTVDIEAYETGNNTLTLQDKKGVNIAQGANNKILQQSLTPGDYYVHVPVEEGYCKAGIRVTSTDAEGNTIDRPIPITIEKTTQQIETSSSQIADTSGEKEKDVFFFFNLDSKLRCYFTLYYSCRTEKSRVFITVLNEKKEMVAKAFAPNYSTNLLCDLEPGKYYLVCEAGEGNEGNLILSALFRPTPPPPTPDPEEPEKPVNPVIPEIPNVPEQPESYTPSESSNYIQIIIPSIGSDSLAHFSYLSKAIHHLQYYDQLGRPVQEIDYKASPTRKDLVTYQEYDKLGRDSRQWLPIVRTGNTSGTWMKPDTIALDATKGYQDNCAFSNIVYDDSPLNRTKEVYGPGEKWQSTGHGNKYDYRINTAGNQCIWFYAGGTKEHPSLCQRGIYPAYELEVKSTKDEDEHQVFSFTDKQGNLILNRCIADNDTLDTYHVYDDYGNRSFVLPPAAADSLPPLLQTNKACQSTLDKYAYQYRYDYRNRCIAKKLPGCDWTEMIYDTNNRLLFTQDGNQRKRDEWSFEFSDLLGRLVLSGLYHGNISSQDCNTTNIYVSYLPDSISALYGYVVHCPESIHTNSLQVLKVNYYDTYDFKNQAFGFNTSLNYVADDSYGKECTSGGVSSLHSKDLITGSMIRVLDNEEKLYECYYYDFNRNMIQSRHTTLNGGISVSKSAFNFSGEPTAICEEHDNSVPLKKLFIYDHAKRLKEETHIIGNDTTRFSYSFDENGRLKSLTRINGKDSLTTTNSYNIRSWLTGIDSPLFKQTLHYTDGVGTPCYNGNISSMTWKTDSLSTSQAVKGYKFTYDNLSRLKDAIYGEGNDLTINPNRFNEQVTAYDKLGNIISLKRYGQISEMNYGIIDNLSLAYNGNQLLTASDAATGSAYGNGFEFKDGAQQPTEYTYDSNGNLTQDLNKKITDIQYNCLNLPSRIQFENGNSISYLYDANGVKLRTTHVVDGNTLTTDYCDNAIYENGVLNKLLTIQGYITLSDTVYHYFLQDHQGNNRMIVNQKGVMEEANEYYPFGGLFTSTGNVQPFKYNGKELDRKDGLDWYDYGARRYDAAIGRWNAVDPLSEEFESSSPYNYCMNNPANQIDPDGMETEPTVELPEVTIIGQKVMPPVSGVWNTIDYLLFGRTLTIPVYGITNNGKTDNSIGYITYKVDKEGIATSIVPLGGIAPAPSTTGLTIKDIMKLLKASRTMMKGGLTAVGRGLKKHGDRVGTVYPKAVGNQAAINQQGEQLLKKILTHPNVTKTVKEGTLKADRYGKNNIDIYIPGGIGARFNADGTKFIGFLEPNIKK